MDLKDVALPVSSSNMPTRMDPIKFSSQPILMEIHFSNLIESCLAANDNDFRFS